MITSSIKQVRDKLIAVIITIYIDSVNTMTDTVFYFVKDQQMKACFDPVFKCYQCIICIMCISCYYHHKYRVVGIKHIHPNLLLMQTLPLEIETDTW